MSGTPHGSPLVRGNEYLERHDGFVLKGRDAELKTMADILMRKNANSILLTGESGVGLTAMTLGMQASKSDLTTPLDIVSKRFYWLDSDEMFSSGDPQRINTAFDQLRATLTRNPDSVLVIESAADFITSARNAGATHLLNGFMADLKAGKYQAILESPTKNVGSVLESDADFSENFTTLEIKEPRPKQLREIVGHAAEQLSKHHGIAIDPAAIESAIQLTEKYKLQEFRAQPTAAVTLLDRSLSAYKNRAQRTPPALERMDRDIETAINGLKGDAKAAGGRTPQELESLLATLKDDRKRFEEKWAEQQKTVRLLHNEQRVGEEEIRKLEDKIEKVREEDAETQKDTEAKVEKGELKKEFLSTGGGFLAGQENPRITEIRKEIAMYDRGVKEGRKKYDLLRTEINAGLKLGAEHVLSEFSQISGIAVEKLTEDERAKLLNLEETISERVIGQPEPVQEVSKAIRRARAGLSMPNKPQGVFLFMGPSGVGKTELAKALASALNGDEKSLLRFDMSEYMEEHAVAKLIGAPPGYEGYAVGGILTNAVRRNPQSIVLFDEIEKAHDKIFNVMLQVLDDARLTDSRGLTSNFNETIIIMTTNIGTPHFLNKDLDTAGARELALHDLEKRYPPEFLGRFNGNIYCFNRLDEMVLGLIAKKDLTRIGKMVEKYGVSLHMDTEDMMAMITDHYDMKKGARSILGYMDRNITSGLADALLKEGLHGGVLQIGYDKETKKPILTHYDDPVQTAQPVVGGAAPVAALT